MLSRAAVLVAIAGIAALCTLISIALDRLDDAIDEAVRGWGT